MAYAYISIMNGVGFLLKGGLHNEEERNFLRVWKDVLYTEKDKYMSAELKGATYNYYGKVAVCVECANEIFVNEINNYNLPAAVSTDRKIEKKLIGDYFTAVKEKNNMLNPSDIGVYSKKMFEQIFM